MHRLFSNFANGWPGRGLLVLRLLTSAALLDSGLANLREALPLQVAILHIIAAATGLFILVGLWTPLAGTLAMIDNLLIAFTRYSSHSGDPWIPVIGAALGASLAMIGPGALSIDARLFGRRHIDVQDDE